MQAEAARQTHRAPRLALPASNRDELRREVMGQVGEVAGVHESSARVGAKRQGEEGELPTRGIEEGWRGNGGGRDYRGVG